MELNWISINRFIIKRYITHHLYTFSI